MLVLIVGSICFVFLILAYIIFPKRQQFPLKETLVLLGLIMVVLYIIGVK